jgi:hypothetical protein
VIVGRGAVVGRDDAAVVEHGRLGSSEKLTTAATTLKPSIRVYRPALTAH